MGTGGMPSTTKAEFGWKFCGAGGGPLGALCAEANDSEERTEKRMDTKQSFRFMRPSGRRSFTRRSQDLQLACGGKAMP
ncbi:MAG: hypothetical protein DMG64_17610 [Acidobacteria bacterium]|nr:MAG: hypothetical protein DMG63_17620 [Acidobacteriota bacterium]PYY00121.1 MAG: hypothetical protein DMG64_17610 [Acidobacteriota bacterium]